MAFALRDLGKEVRVVNRDPVPHYLASFPGVADIEVRDTVDGTFDAAIVLECGSLARTEVSGLEQHFVINIDHHVGNTMYGNLNWFDASAAACGEMVFGTPASQHVLSEFARLSPTRVSPLPRSPTACIRTAASESFG